MKTASSLVLASLLVFAPAAWAQDQSLIRNVSHLISASGRGEVRAKPDVILLSIGVRERGADVAAPRTRAAKKVTDIVAALKSAGVKPAEIQTTQFSVNRVWESLNAQNQPIEYPEPTNKGHYVFQVTNMVSVRSGLIGKAGEILDAVVKAGANEINGPTFGLKDSAPQQKQALADAVKDARSKADSMAGAAGVTITELDHLTEQSNSFAGFDNLTDNSLLVSSSGDSAPAPRTPISAGEVVVTASVTADYRFE